MFIVDFELYAKRKLGDWMVVGPVEPLFGPLIELLVHAVAVEAVFLELVVQRSVLGSVGTLDLAVVDNFVNKVL